MSVPYGPPDKYRQNSNVQVVYVANLDSSQQGSYFLHIQYLARFQYIFISHSPWYFQKCGGTYCSVVKDHRQVTMKNHLRPSELSKLTTVPNLAHKDARPAMTVYRRVQMENQGETHNHPWCCGDENYVS